MQVIVRIQQFTSSLILLYIISEDKTKPSFSYTSHFLRLIRPHWKIHCLKHPKQKPQIHNMAFNSILNSDLSPDAVLIHDYYVDHDGRATS